MTKRKKISHNTERLLWAMSAGRCEKCGRLIYQHPLSKVIGNFAQIAHNLPVGEDGPRSNYKLHYKQIDSSLNIDNIQNLLLLCYDCHKEIDETRIQDYPPELLKKMKADFEEFVVKATNIERIKPTIALKYSANLHGQRLLVTGIQKALFPDKVIAQEVDLTLKNSSFFVGDSQFWAIEEKNLERIFSNRVVPVIENYQNGFINISVFAIAPIPLLVKLGELLSNKHNIDVYQLKKSPILTWEWENTDDDIEYETCHIQICENPRKIILIFSLSGLVKHDDVKKVLPWDNTTVIEIKTNEPFDDFLRSEKQLEKFVRCYRHLKEKLRNMCESNVMIHVFAAVPVSVAVEIGRQRNNTVDLPLTIYNYTNSAYEKAIVIGEKYE